jgi:hypothetical protein
MASSETYRQSNLLVSPLVYRWVPRPVMAARFGFLEGEGGSADFRPYDSRVPHLRAKGRLAFGYPPSWSFTAHRTGGYTLAARRPNRALPPVGIAIQRESQFFAGRLWPPQWRSAGRSSFETAAAGGMSDHPPGLVEIEELASPFGWPPSFARVHHGSGRRLHFPPVGHRIPKRS